LRAHLLGKELVVGSLRQEAPPLTGVFRVVVRADEISPPEWFYRPPAPPAATNGQTQGVEQAPSGGAEPDQAAVGATDSNGAQPDAVQGAG
jgi:hypothetical protein